MNAVSHSSMGHKPDMGHWAKTKKETRPGSFSEAPGKNPAPCSVGPRSLFPGWLSAGDCFQLLESVHIP